MVQHSTPPWASAQVQAAIERYRTTRVRAQAHPASTRRNQGIQQRSNKAQSSRHRNITQVCGHCCANCLARVPALSPMVGTRAVLGYGSSYDAPASARKREGPAPTQAMPLTPSRLPWIPIPCNTPPPCPRTPTQRRNRTACCAAQGWEAAGDYASLLRPA